MRLNEARVVPLLEDEWNDEVRDLLEPTRLAGRVLNIMSTLARHPAALRDFLPWGGYVLSKRGKLPARERELVILRTGYLCRSGYEWAQHVVVGRHAGLTDEEIERIKVGPDDPAWSAADATLLRAADELHDEQFVSGPTWTALSASWDERQVMQVVLAAGQYTMVSMALNSFGVQLDDGLDLDPDLDHRTTGA